jgi:hypothetical protein
MKFSGKLIWSMGWVDVLFPICLVVEILIGRFSFNLSIIVTNFAEGSCQQCIVTFYKRSEKYYILVKPNVSHESPFDPSVKLNI